MPGEMLASLPNYDEYALYGQGHDLLIYQDWWKLWRLDGHIGDSLLLQERSFQEFVFQFLTEAADRKLLESEQVRLFIGPGYVAHHILDSCLHPLIIHYSGDHIRMKENQTWKHGIIENLLDAYFMELFEGKDCRTCPVYEDFRFPAPCLDRGVSEILDRTLAVVYRIRHGGRMFEKGLLQTKGFIRIMKNDPSGMKRKAFLALDFLAKGSASFSYHVAAAEAEEYLNLDHRCWKNPKSPQRISTKSMPELYEEALEESVRIVSALDRLCVRGSFTRDEIYSIVPDRTATYALPCENGR